MDACGNISDTVTQTISVIDNTPPTITTPGANATIQCTQTPVFTAPTASDNCNVVSIDSFDTHGGTHCDSIFTRHWYAVDACGNISDTVSQTITVVDTTPPTIRHTGENHSIECSAAVVFGFAIASDNCNVVSIDSFDTHGGTHCDSIFTRHWYAIDACGNRSDTVSQTITVIDNIAPTVSGQGDDTTLSCVVCQTNGVPGFKAPVATDNCDPNPVLHSLRDSIPGSCPQSYTIVKKWWAVDACGNISDTVSQSISVIDNTPPTITPAWTTVTDQCEPNHFFSVSVNDGCDNAPNIFHSDTTIHTSCAYTYSVVRKWWSIDHCGNISDTVSQTINVVDVAPSLSAQGANEFVNCVSCQVCAPGFTPPTVTTGCDAAPRVSLYRYYYAGQVHRCIHYQENMD